MIKIKKNNDSWGRGYGYLCDQLRRAMASIVLNLAEGNSRRSKQERRRFFEIAIGSTNEVAAIMDVASALNIGSIAECEKIKDELCEIAKMTAKLP